MEPAKQSDKDDSQATHFKDYMPDIADSIKELRKKQFYPFSERLTGLAAMLIISTFVLLLAFVLADSDIGKVEKGTALTIVFGIAGAPGIILVPLATLVTAFERGISHINKKGDELIPNYESAYRMIASHLFRILGSLIIFYGYYQYLIKDSYGNAWVSIFAIILLSSIIVFAVGLLLSGVGGFVLYFTDN